MGSRTYASNEANIARVGNTSMFSEHNETVAEADDRKADPTTDPAYTLNNWRIHRGQGNLYKGKLYPESYTGPNGEVVHVLNSSQYAAVGEEDWVVFGADPKHVRAFLNACGFTDVRIIKTDIVMQTL